MLQGYIAKKWGDRMFEDDMAKIVKKHAFWAALIMFNDYPHVVRLYVLDLKSVL